VKTVEFQLAGGGRETGAADLGNALTGISGVELVAIDPDARTVSVEYDPAFVDPLWLRRSIDGSGYLVASQNEDGQS
jgi:copper chaperone CopZ